MSDDQNIFKISSNYSLKIIFSYIEYKRTLNIIKYNKNLQSRLDLDLKDYTIFEYNKIPVSNKKFLINYDIFDIVSAVSFCTKGVLLIYQYIFILIFLSKYLYNIININFEKYLIIFRFSCFLCYAFNLYIMLSMILLYMDLRSNSKISWTLLIINLLIYLIVFSLLIWIATIIYEFEKSKNNIYSWAIICIIILIVLYFFVIISLIVLILFFFKYYYRVAVLYKYFITKYKGIKIKDVEIINEFFCLNPNEQKEFLIKYKNLFKYYLNKEQVDIIRIINNYRVKLKLPILQSFEKEIIPNIINDIDDKYYFSSNNIFKISASKYVFKYPVNQFKQELVNNNEIIFKILSNDSFNKIIIIQKKNYEYIIVYNSNEESNKIVPLRIDYIPQETEEELRTDY